MGQVFIPGIGLIDDGQPGPSWQEQPPAPEQQYTGPYYDPNDKESAWNAWRLQNQQQTNATNQGLVSDLARQSGGVGARTSNIRQGQVGIVQQGMNNDAVTQQKTQQLVDQLRGVNDAANQYDWGALGPYQDALAGYTRQNNQALSGLQGLYGQLANPLQSQTRWEGDLTSQAASAYADPNSIAAQNNAMGFLSGAMNGSLNYQSQGAQAYADPASIQAEYQALNQLQNAAAGGLDVQSQAATAEADQAAIDMQSQGLSGLWGIANGRLDIMPWSADPKSWDDLQRAKGQYQDVYGGSLDVTPGQLNPEAFDPPCSNSTIPRRWLP